MWKNASQASQASHSSQPIGHTQASHVAFSAVLMVGFVAQIAFAKDSLSESIVLSGGHEQLDTYEVQDPELGRV